MNIKIKGISIKTKESQVDIDDIEIDLDPSSVLKSSSPLNFPGLKFNPNLFKEMKYDPFEHMKFESDQKESLDPLSGFLNGEFKPQDIFKIIDSMVLNPKNSDKNDLND